MGCAGPVASRAGYGSTAEMDETAAHRRDPVADQGWRAVARCAGAVRGVADDLRTVPAVAARRDLGADPGQIAGPRGCGRAHPRGTSAWIPRSAGRISTPQGPVGTATRRSSHPVGCRSSLPITRWDGLSPPTQTAAPYGERNPPSTSSSSRSVTAGRPPRRTDRRSRNTVRATDPQ